MLSPDYAKFTIERGIVKPGERMVKKLDAIPFPDMEGKRVLDIGCDYGQFSFLCASWGAEVLGIDRNRTVKGVGPVDLIQTNNQNAKEHRLNCFFEGYNIGKQWPELGKFDHILLMSVYHHIYENCGDHDAIWYWLWRHCGESLIFEGPLEPSDRVVQMNVSKPYREADIFRAAHMYFESEYVGPALHEPHRSVFIFRPKRGLRNEYSIALQDGAGGATNAFEYDNGRRMKEIENVLGYSPYPGSLNGILNRDFNWHYHYLPAQILDVVDRQQGVRSEWSLRDVRFFPITANGESFKAPAHIMRFKGEAYPSNFVEIISPYKLRDIGIITEIELCA